LRKSSAADYSLESSTPKDVVLFFNICANAATPRGHCGETKGTDGEVMSLPAPGFAFDPTFHNTTCKRLGNSINSKESFHVEVLDKEKPVEGIRMKYTGGNTCPGTALYPCPEGGCRHSLEVLIFCDGAKVLFPEIDRVEVGQPCDYKVIMKSVHGCPVDCPRNDLGDICSARGLCQVSNKGNGDFKAACLCQSEFYGDHCQHLVVEKTLTEGTISLFGWEQLIFPIGGWFTASVLLLVVWRYKIGIWRFWLKCLHCFDPEFSKHNFDSNLEVGANKKSKQYTNAT